jgi:hypothetical protein
MTPAAISRRLAAIERNIAPRPGWAGASPLPVGFEWAGWTSNDELDFLAEVAEGMAYGIEPRPEQERRWLSVEAACLARMLRGEPSYCDQRAAEQAAAAAKSLP